MTGIALPCTRDMTGEVALEELSSTRATQGARPRRQCVYFLKSIRPPSDIHRMTYVSAWEHFGGTYQDCQLSPHH